ncbi:MAG: GIY-YIG nuclease family protein [Bacteroidales bacterium]|nr:GIY-YIG nuclease family protein [Bacteroidales bacterium]MCF8344887.1 GIY-YIG nuclease family protein [Bacteroidales bacterium]MCF8351496.1 GIY-YIG nuclease family protein [Bacteroidales bacterium]MCF8374721.1 GIY-YIG nuclease family protein [Bacteroidales bacterium]
MQNNHTYYVYIMTNRNRKVLYVGITNSLGRRVYEHEKGMIKGFTKKYNCHYLVYYELFNDIDLAINREKQIKKWRRDKKDALIRSKNATFESLNDKVRFW